ncbi:Cysteine desulfurase mitochondrial [Dionaea muscipula]
MLESILESRDEDEDVSREKGRTEAKRHALDFINEIGWLLHRSHVKSRLGTRDPNDEFFSFKRFKWIMEYSMDHDWCAVVKKLLDILLEGIVGAREHPSLNVALSEMGLLHRAVRRNCRPLVELLLRYVPVRMSEEFGYKDISVSDQSHQNFLFRPDATGPAGVTPLHIAAGRDGSEDVLDALTEDPEKIGIETWKKARDSTGCTPEDYARLRGHYAYIHLVQKKINKRSLGGTSVVLDIADSTDDINPIAKQPSTGGLEIERRNVARTMPNCKLCADRRKQAGYYGNGGGSRSLVYKPAMLFMVAIAAVCVCVALLFKTLPEVVCIFEPFRWESLEYGSS